MADELKRRGASTSSGRTDELEKAESLDLSGVKGIVPTGKPGMYAVDLLEFLDSTQVPGLVLSGQARKKEQKMAALDPEEQRVYDATAAGVLTGDFSKAFGDAAVSLHRIQRDMATKYALSDVAADVSQTRKDIKKIMRILKNRQPPIP